MEEEEENKNNTDPNPDALEAAIGDDFVEVEVDEYVEVIGYGEDGEEEDDVTIAFSQDDPRDWY